ncbi:(2Fe-2S)-binding protein [Granulosicoccaceae sp. 1_MG-2023]|nr:(2Fe-2S)-binding protein [Granulosicoccaceae sp. 1_MG-2023]
MIVCVCKRISDSRIREAVQDGCHTMDDVREELGVASQCGRCSDCALEVVVDELQQLSVKEADIAACL